MDDDYTIEEMNELLDERDMENDRLRAEIARLTQQNQALAKQVDLLESELRMMRSKHQYPSDRGTTL